MSEMEKAKLVRREPWRGKQGQPGVGEGTRRGIEKLKPVWRALGLLWKWVLKPVLWLVGFLLAAVLSALGGGSRPKPKRSLTGRAYRVWRDDMVMGTVTDPMGVAANRAYRRALAPVVVWLIIGIVVVSLLSGCASVVEMPTEGEGSDAMRESPCACERLDYDGRGYRWLG